MNNIKGFSLVELMVAVGIVGVMSSVAVPKYQKYKVEASRSEAKSNMASIYTLQQLYYTDKDQYTGLSSLDFTLSGGQKYTYGAVASGTDSTQFKATAVSKKVLGSCAYKGLKDKWCMNHEKVMLDGDSSETNGQVTSIVATNTSTGAPCLAADTAFGGCP